MSGPHLPSHLSFWLAGRGLRGIGVLVCLLATAQACRSDDSNSTGENPPDCEDVDVCVGICGVVTDACGQLVNCGACIDPETLASMMETVEEVITTLGDEGYMTDLLEIDPDALRDRAEEILLTSVDNDLGLLTALSQTLQAYRNGHSAIGLSSSFCRDVGGADVSMTAYGVCAKPYRDHFVVTHQPGSSNPLGLGPGDRIVALNGRLGVDLIDAILGGALCVNGAGNPDVRHEHAAESLFSTIRPGDELTVLDAGTDELRTILVESAGSDYLECRFPAGSVYEPMVETELRPDGVAVVRLRRFFLFPHEPGYVEATTEPQVWEYINNMISQVEDEFHAIEPLADGIIWDVRGNSGGASPVGFEIAAGMPGAESTPLARCTTRIPRSDPIQYWALGPDYDLSPSATFATTKPTAVLTDGLTISAGDYFALAVSLGTDAVIFGRPTAGAYGGGGMWKYLDPAQQYYLSYDPYRCNDLNGEALETHSTPPDQWVEYAPADLVQGLDTVLESAAQWIRDQ